MGGEILRYCTRCGHEIPEGARFCRVCGAAQPEVGLAPVRTGIGRFWRVIVAGVMVLGVAGAFAFTIGWERPNSIPAAVPSSNTMVTFTPSQVAAPTVPSSTTSTTASSSTTTTTVPIGRPEPDAAYPESWASALIDAVNGHDFNLVAGYPGADEDSFRDFVEQVGGSLTLIEPCRRLDSVERLFCFVTDGRGNDWVVDFNTGSAGESFVSIAQTVYFGAIGFFQPYASIAADGAFGSGCTPGMDQLPDGDWFGSAVQRLRNSIEFDLMCLVPDPEYDSTIRNQNPKLRKVPVPQGVTVTLSRDGAWLVDVPYEQWAGMTRRMDSQCYVWLHVRNGRLVHISEMFFS